MITNIQNLYSRKELVWAWTYRIIRGRYQQSIFGGLWAIIQPVASVLIFTVIFTLFVPVDTGGTPYIVFSYTAMVPWTLFSTSVLDMVDSLVGNINLISKVYFPREVLPVSALLARLVDFFIAFSLLFVLIIYFHIPIFVFGWLFIPVILITQLGLSLGLGLIGSSLNVFYRDIKPVFTLGMQIWFYATPIIYPVTSVPPQFRTLYFLNPMAGVIEAYRAVILNQELPGSYFVLSTAVALGILLLGYWFFKRVEFNFADVI
jgi:homopolymeric O-antigen transport system permease protein